MIGERRQLQERISAVSSAAMVKYNAASAAFFAYLAKRSTSGFTSRQFQLYRDNYLFRTATTCEGIARTALWAALNGDRRVLAGIAKNLNEECGEGCPGRNHQTLLERCHDLHGAQVFGLEPGVTVRDAEASPLVLPEARAYREVYLSLFTNTSYAQVLGASFAQESAADDMLRRFYRCLFEPYRGWYLPAAFDAATEYFTLHLDGVEEGHGRAAKAALQQVCTESAHVESAGWGIARFLNAQSALWDALHHAMERTEGDGAIVVVQPSR